MVGVGVAKPGRSPGAGCSKTSAWGAIFLVNVPIAVGGDRRRVAIRSDVARPCGPAGRRRGLGPVRRRRRPPLVYTIIGAPNVGWTNWHTPSPDSRWPPSSSPHSRCGSCARLIRCSTCRSFFNRRFSGGSPAITGRFLTLVRLHLSSSPSTSNSSRPTAHLRPVCGYRRSRSRSRSVVSSAPHRRERIGTTAVVAGGLAIFAAGLAWASTVDAGTPTLWRSPRRWSCSAVAWA